MAACSEVAEAAAIREKRDVGVAEEVLKGFQRMGDRGGFLLVDVALQLGLREEAAGGTDKCPIILIILLIHQP